MKTASILLLFALVPAVAVQFTVPEPVDRDIHVESFRYGKDPHTIRVNRGDRLRLTFSARETGHSFFLEEFGMDVKVRPGTEQVEIVDPARPDLGVTRAHEVRFEAEPPGFLGRLCSRYQYRCHVWCGPMHAFEHGTLVIWPNTLLAAALGMLLGIPFVGWRRVRKGIPPAPRPTGIDLLARFPRLRALAKRRGFQVFFTVIGLVFLYVVILTCLLGTQNAGRNLGVMLLWVVWLVVLIAVMTPLGGRIWCLVCPLPLLGETIQRGTLTGVRLAADGTKPDPDRSHNNECRGLDRPWPKRLDNAWLRILGMLGFGTFTVALVAKPAATGWALLGMIVLATVLALIFERRAFCRWVCPISAFVGIFGKMGRLKVHAASLDVCAECSHKPCLKGSMKGWGCPFGLNVEEIRENGDCGFCSECVKTCPKDNVAVTWGSPGPAGPMRTISEAWLSILMFVLAAAYAVLYLGPWPAVRDWVNILDKGNWGPFALYAAGLWTLALLLAPAIVYGTAKAGAALSGDGSRARSAFLAMAGSLMPISLAGWICFATPMLTVNLTFVIQSLSDPFGWGWDFLGTRNTVWKQFMPQWIPWLQAAVILFGVSGSLRSATRNWRDLVADPAAAFRAAIPFSLLILAVGAGFIVFYTG